MQQGPPNGKPSMTDLLRTLDRVKAGEQLPPMLGAPPFRSDAIPPVDIGNPFMQQMTDTPSLLTAALVTAQGPIAQEQRAITTWRNATTTLTLVASREQLLAWIQTLTNVADQMSALIVSSAPTPPPAGGH